VKTDPVLLEVAQLRKFFPIRRGLLKKTVAHVKAVDGVNLFIREGETLGLVGESGCGKTTVGRTILRLIEPTSGQILFRSKKLVRKNETHRIVDIARASSGTLKALRREMQLIFQDPYSSLNPRMTVEALIGEPMLVYRTAAGREKRDRIRYLLEAVGLNPAYMRRYPHEFSGGQRQRIGIARALALEPQLVVADEPVSALDVSIQAQVMNLLDDLQNRFHLTYLFIAHDLSVVKHISTRVAVMYLGKIFELAKTEALFSNPKHPYTEALMSAVPIPDPDFSAKRITLKGDVPSPVNPPSGCTFHPRCNYAQDVCKNRIPEYREIDEDHFVTCHMAQALRLRPIWF